MKQHDFYWGPFLPLPLRSKNSQNFALEVGSADFLPLPTCHSSFIQYFDLNNYRNYMYIALYHAFPCLCFTYTSVQRAHMDIQVTLEIGGGKEVYGVGARTA
jgi:hypothetical protein